jgi:predicted transcriptional regulator
MNHASQPKFDVLLQIPLDLADIEARIKAGHSLRDIASDLGVNANTIQNRRRGKNRAFQKEERNRTLRSLPRNCLLLLEQENNKHGNP